MTRTAAIYVRQSLDKSGEQAAVTRQLAECRAFCSERGWDVGQVFTDNDTSATSGKARPGFDALLDSNPERIVVWHVDRLARLTADLERVITLGVNVYAVRAGDLDLSNPAGRAVARTIVAWATYEGEQKAVRQRAANRQRAEQGVSLWTRRPYGFERQGAAVRVVEGEAKVIRDCAGRALSGTPMGRLARELNEAGVPTSTGSRWTTTSLKRVLLSPRVAGRITYNGEDYGDSGLAILDADTADRLRALLTDPRRKTAPPSTRAKYMLSGVVRCGRDGCDDEPMHAVPNAQRRLIYRCRKCYGGRGLEDVDKFVLAVVANRLAQPDLLARLLVLDVDLDALRRRVVELRDRRDGIAAMLGEGLVSVEVAREQARRLTDEISGVEREIAQALGTSPLARLVGAEDLAGALSRLSFAEMREVVRDLAVVRILPAGKGVRFDPSQVEIVWR